MTEGDVMAHIERSYVQRAAAGEDHQALFREAEREVERLRDENAELQTRLEVRRQQVDRLLDHRAEAEVERLRKALHRIAHPDPDDAAFYDYSVAEEIAREALRDG